MADSRKEDTDFYYWLNVVELLADDSPLLIVKNEKQDRQREINEKQLRGEFDNLKDVFATNLATTRGLPDLLKAIQYHIKTLPHVGSPLPKTWVKVREVLEEDMRYTISFHEYLVICEQHGFTKHEDKLQLSRYLHDLGVCLHFQDDPVLKSIVIIKPEWATDAVYRVLDNQRVINHQGRFSKKELVNIWNKNEYKCMQDELLQLMIKFKLCYQIKHSNWYIAPQLLTFNKPSYGWREHDNLLLRYKYTFMPKGIMTRFIVAMHHLIARSDYVWHSGVILNDQRTIAEVIEHYGKSEIYVRVVGRHKKRLMTKIEHELEKIHKSFKRLKYQKLIPCNCKSCYGQQTPHFYAFDTLLKFRADRQLQIQCQNSYKMVNVLSLIDDIQLSQHKSQGPTQNQPTIHVHTEQFLLQDFKDSDVVQDITPNRKDEQMAKRKKKKTEPKSPWASGLFYLFVFVVVISSLGVLANSIPLFALAIVLIAGVLFIPVIGALQLRQDDNLGEKSFIQLMRIVIGQLPLIGKALPSPEPKEEGDNQEEAEKEEEKTTTK